jgi:hypothetical protein
MKGPTVAVLAVLACLSHSEAGWLDNNDAGKSVQQTGRDIKGSLKNLGDEIPATPAGKSKWPKVALTVQDPALSDGIGSLNIESEYEVQLTGDVADSIADSVTAGLRYEYNANKALPNVVFAKAVKHIDENTLEVEAQYDIASQVSRVDATLRRGRDHIGIDFDSDGVVGPLRIRKSLDFNGRSVVIKPRWNARSQTGSLEILGELDADASTFASLTLDQATEDAVLEVCHRLDEDVSITPRVNLTPLIRSRGIGNGDIALKLNRRLGEGAVLELEVNDRREVGFEFNDRGTNGKWTVTGNIPFDNTNDARVAFRRTLEL